MSRPPASLHRKFHRMTRFVGISPSFRAVALIASAICLALSITWIFLPQFLLWIWRVDATQPALLMARRSGALFLGLSAMLFLARDCENSPARRSIAAGLSIACASLSALGIFEFSVGHAGKGIGLAVAVELALAIAFALSYFGSWPGPAATSTGDSASMDVLGVVSLAPSPRFSLLKTKADRTVNPPSA